MPNLLQAAIFAREFADVLYFTRPPLFAQRLMFGGLAATARILGYRGSYPKYTDYSQPDLSGAEGTGPPSAARVALGAFAVAALPLLAYWLLFGGRASPRSPGR